MSADKAVRDSVWSVVSPLSSILLFAFLSLSPRSPFFILFHFTETHMYFQCISYVQKFKKLLAVPRPRTAGTTFCTIHLINPILMQYVKFFCIIS